MSSEYPIHLARGITRPECLDEDRIKNCVFQFYKNNDNGLCEMSIQWMDNEESERIAKSMMKRDRSDPKFGLGFAVMKTAALDEIKSSGYYEGMDYCRAPNASPESYNPYHGHVTIPQTMNSKTRQLAAELVMRSKLYKYEQPLPIG